MKKSKNSESFMKTIMCPEDIICWYPSSGCDLASINNWTRNIGNELKPNVFLFTDCEYAIVDGEGVKHMSSNLLEEIIGCDYTVEYFSELTFGNCEKENSIEILTVVDNNNQYHHLAPEDYLELIEYTANRGDVISRLREYRDKPIWIAGDLDVSGKEGVNLGGIAGISGYLNIRNTNLSRETFNNIVVERIYSDTDIVNNSFVKRMACISFNDIKIIIIYAKNEVFYKYLFDNSIKIDCFFGKRTSCDFTYIDSLNSIGVKEVMAGEDVERDLLENDNNYKKVSEPFTAESSEFQGDFVTLYKLKK
jgi:hypothetical protein